MKYFYYLIRLILKRKVKWSFCSGCMKKVWKLKGYRPETGKAILKCGVCETISYT